MARSPSTPEPEDAPTREHALPVAGDAPTRTHERIESDPQAPRRGGDTTGSRPTEASGHGRRPLLRALAAVLLGLVVAAAAWMALQSNAGTSAVVTVGANVRAGPSVNADSVGGLAAGREIRVDCLVDGGTWARLAQPSEGAHVAASLIQIERPKPLVAPVMNQTRASLMRAKVETPKRMNPAIRATVRRTWARSSAATGPGGELWRSDLRFRFAQRAPRRAAGRCGRARRTRGSGCPRTSAVGGYVLYIAGRT
jgi:hypothetical protein